MKRVLVAGLMGGLVLILWAFVVNGLLGLHSRMLMRQIAAESEVYAVLKDHVTEPGRYTVNPELTPERRYPEGEPVFSVSYSGVGHEAAGGIMLLGLVIFFAAPITGAWLLSHASEPVLSSYSRKVLFFTGIGLLLGMFNGLTKWDIGGLPMTHAVVLAISDVAVWTLVGLVVAWRLGRKEAHAVAA